MLVYVISAVITGLDGGLSPGRHQAIIWTNAGILLIGSAGTNFDEMLNEIHTFSFKKMHFKMSSGKWRQFCLGLNVLNIVVLWYCAGSPLIYTDRPMSLWWLQMPWCEIVFFFHYWRVRLLITIILVNVDTTDDNHTAQMTHICVSSMGSHWSRYKYWISTVIRGLRNIFYYNSSDDFKGLFLLSETNDKSIIQDVV